MKKKKLEILYPLLAECCEFCTDSNLREIFEDLSTGKGGKALYVQNGMVLTANKKNGFSYTFSDKTPSQIYLDLSELILTQSGICANKELEKRKKYIDEIKDEFENYERWSNIKRKNVKDRHILNFAIKMAKQYNLDSEMVYRKINSLFDFKTHSSKDVDFYDGCIQEIDDLTFSSEGVINEREGESDLKDKEDVKKSANLQEYVTAYLKILSKTIN